MDAIEMALRQLDDLWDHEWESLASVLRGLTDEEARWQAPCYAGVETPAGEPQAGTILWQVAHVAGCKREYAAFFGATGAAPDAVAPSAGIAAFLEDLARAHRTERAALSVVKRADLERVLPNGQTVLRQIAIALRHDAWHAGQIALARRLWRAR